jgi:hypothetical protein
LNTMEPQWMTESLEGLSNKDKTKVTGQWKRLLADFGESFRVLIQSKRAKKMGPIPSP